MSDVVVTSDEDKYANESFENESEHDSDDVLSESNSESDAEPQSRSINPSSLYAYTRTRLNRRNNFQVNEYAPYYNSSSDENDDVVISQTIAEVNTDPMHFEEELSSQSENEMRVRTSAIAKMVITQLKIKKDTYQTSVTIAEPETPRKSRESNEEISDAVIADEKDEIAKNLPDYDEPIQGELKPIESDVDNASHFLPTGIEDDKLEEVERKEDDLTPRQVMPTEKKHGCKDVDKFYEFGEETLRPQTDPQLVRVVSQRQGGTYEYEGEVDYFDGDAFEPFGATSGDDEFQRQYYFEMRNKIAFDLDINPPSDFDMHDYEIHSVDIVKPSKSVDRVKGQRKSWSFTNERMREIERSNHILLKKILTQKPTYSSNPQKVQSQNKFADLPPTTRVTSAAVNRKKKQRQIDLENQLLKRRLESISLRRPLL